MKTHDYLTSGILESYLLGLVSDQQREDVERLLTTDPEIVSYLDQLEVDMEQHFLRNATPPPPSVRAAVLQRINESEIQKWTGDEANHTNTRKPDAEPHKPNYIDVEVSNTHIQVHKYWRPAFIAVFILSKIFLILGLYYYFKSNSLEQEIIRLKASAQQTAPYLPNRTP